MAAQGNEGSGNHGDIVRGSGGSTHRGRDLPAGPGGAGGAQSVGSGGTSCGCGGGSGGISLAGPEKLNESRLLENSTPLALTETGLVTEYRGVRVQRALLQDDGRTPKIWMVPAGWAIEEDG